MASKNNKPYKNQVNSRTTNSNKSKEKKNNTNKNNTTTNLENTIRINAERLNDYDTLDTSFLEGRIENKEKYYSVKDRSNSSGKVILKTLLIIMIVLISVFAVSFVVYTSFFVKEKNDKVEDNNKSIVEKRKVIDDVNIIFLGDMYTHKLDLKEIDYPNVKISETDLRLEDVKNDLNNKIYTYNPSDLFISLGNYDMKEKVSSSEMLDYFREIIKGVQENRPYCSIYVESLYPVKDDNEKIIDFNNKLKELTKELNVKYLDVFKELTEESKIKDEYYDEDELFNDDGYERIKKIIYKVVEDEK